MNKETLERAAEEYVMGNSASYVECFEAGANWRINSVWHDGNVSCQTRRKALVLFKNGNSAVYNDLRDLTFERMWGEVDKFAYIDELMPDRKEATL